MVIDLKPRVEEKSTRMDAGLQIAMISAGSAILGTLGGATASYLSTKRISREQWRLTQIDKEITSREKLYGEFLGEASLQGIGAIDKKTNRVADFAPLFTLLSQIRLVATRPVMDAAKALSESVLDAHSAAPSKADAKPFGQTFSQACRTELDALRVKALRKVD